MEENEKKKKSRGWVKDAAIIFLAVLLVLTFFSNTILNRSLPEVATVLVQEGTITNKVRGTGTVSARENYDVTIEQTRQVQSVLVRVGDEVKAGDVLFTLQPGDSDELEQAQKQLRQMEKDLRSLENEYQIWLLGLTEADDYEQDQAVSDAREALQDARTAQAEAAITEEDQAEYEAEIASLEAKIRECEEEIAAQKLLIEEKKAAVDEKQAVVDEKQAVVDEKQADVDAFNDGELREMELQRRELQDEKEAKELIVREKQAVVEEKQAIVAEKQSVVDAAQQKVNEAISTRNQYSSMDPSYAQVSSAELQVQQAQADVDAAEEALAVAMVVNGAQYDLLLKEANLLGYENEVYRLQKDAEPRYRRINGLGSEALTTAQQAEVTAMLAADIAALGAADDYVTQDQSVYLAAAAEKTAYSERRVAYNAIVGAESNLDSAKTRLAQSNNTYSNALADYLNNSGSSSNYYKYDREVDKAQAELDKAKEPLNYAKDVLAAAEKDRDQAKAEVSLVDQALTDLENSRRRLQQEDLADLEAIRDDANKELTAATSELTSAKNDLTTEENKLTEMESDRGDKKLAEQKIESLEKEMKAKEDAYKSAGQNVRDKERALDRAMRNLESAKKSDSAQALRNSVDRQNKQDAIEEKRQDIADQEAKIEELLGTDSGTEVKSNVAGKVQSLSVSAGHKAEAGKTLAVIEVPDLGYSMNFSVTNEQARRLKVGDSATVSNFYWGSQIVATLTAIQTDPQNPQGSKLLTFDVTGDVTVGNSLTISIGERNANYDMVVPNSAVRSDTNGSFVLMITAKNSPLGNRYFASRVNVEVVASDDQYSAISGAIEAYDSVITTASRNAPISSGDQVRLADSN